jgi:hypothetical protein
VVADNGAVLHVGRLHSSNSAVLAGRELPPDFFKARGQLSIKDEKL